MSVIDILTALYFDVLNVDPDAPLNPNRDRLILSKGHTALALYITLSERGFIPKDEISTLLQASLAAEMVIPDCNKVPGIETNTGPLGHGLPVGVGMAKAAKLSNAAWRTFVISGDGRNAGRVELGSRHGSCPVQARQPDSHHRSQPASARRPPGRDKQPLLRWLLNSWLSAGQSRKFDGHDMKAICNALYPEIVASGKPKCVVAPHQQGGRASLI